MKLRRTNLDDVESRLVWILGGPRTGSTWLLEMLVYPLAPVKEADAGVTERAAASSMRARAVPINEPYLGVHLAPVVAVSSQAVFTAGHWRARDSSYFFAEHYEPIWRPQLRRLILERFAAQADLAARERGLRRPLIVVKEPNGSHAAPILMSLFPRSRLLFLLRDGRDVLDSQLDAVSPGSWLAGDADPEGVGSAAGRLEFLTRHAALWLHTTEAVERAAAGHAPELTMTVRYEQLRGETATGLESIASWLALDLSAAELSEVVTATSFDEVPAEQRGRGKPLRLASPGSWAQNLSSEEQAAILGVIGGKLSELGYDT